MRKNASHPSPRNFSDRWWRIPFFGSVLVSLTLLLSWLLIPPSPSSLARNELRIEESDKNLQNQSAELKRNDRYEENPEEESRPELARIAYLITGTKGDSQRMKRTLRAVYHRKNQYVLHLDLEAPPRERIELSAYVREDEVLSKGENVQVIAKGNLVTYKGPTMVACTLHAIALLLKTSAKWDWFINLSASDYPLVTQDDLLEVLSSLPRHLNFIELSRPSTWKLNQRARPIVIDPGLYLSKKFDLFVTSLQRPLPASFDLFTGSAWVMLSRDFVEYCIGGWESLPREVLMYYANFVSSPEGYFHTVICNSPDFRRSAVSHDLHYIAWDTPPKQHPRTLAASDYSRMLASGAPFARKFRRDDPLLDRIDNDILRRPPGGTAALRLRSLIHSLVLPDGSPRNQSCS
ncbi:beta-glucuronosyltransferase GlcAT14B-like [Wolffia australiana]